MAENTIENAKEVVNRNKILDFIRNRADSKKDLVTAPKLQKEIFRDLEIEITVNQVRKILKNDLGLVFRTAKNKAVYVNRARNLILR